MLPFGPDGLLSQVTKAVLVLALAEEMTGHLGYEKHDPAGRGSGNSRNGSTGKTLLTDVGAVDLAVLRGRNGSFEPQIVRKGQTRLEGFNDRIIALYVRGMTTRDIRAHLREMYDVDVSPDLISRVTDGVLAYSALVMAAAVRGGQVSGVILHTDQGSEYTAGLVRQACARLGISQSMGRPGSALDNAVIESWHSTLEFELRSLEDFTTRAVARARVSAWIEDYNTTRRHSALGMMSPAGYERALQAGEAA